LIKQNQVWKYFYLWLVCILCVIPGGTSFLPRAVSIIPDEYDGDNNLTETGTALTSLSQQRNTTKKQMAGREYKHVKLRCVLRETLASQRKQDFHALEVIDVSMITI
jgi:hypothetical protein